MIEIWFIINFEEEKKKEAIRRINRMLRGEGGDAMQSVTSTFDKTWSVPQ